MKILYYILFFISCSLYSKTPDSTIVSTSQELVYDLDSPKEIPQFDTQKIQEFQSQQDFNYIVYEQPDNWWTQFKKWINQLLGKLKDWFFGADEITGFWVVVLRILPYLLIIGLLFLLGWLFMKVSPSELLMEKHTVPQVQFTEDEHIIKHQDIQELIDKALLNKNYRLAIRYSYLFALKKLSNAALIDWEAQKTNADYSNELADQTIKDKFQSITKLYDFIWYGNFEVDEEAYKKAEKDFTAIIHIIQR
ncbi:DUF4129 domain-containing protein [Aquimarina longa]|uniref:DUF4129 domain-containing protein n=1 Tax=Aquimarina longa TaxID=1080221 RepID=UPI0009E7499A|nr:DUF4129 domain-containing protein [Aquimarina longa]